jgi:hypothetical protein
LGGKLFRQKDKDYGAPAEAAVGHFFGRKEFVVKRFPNGEFKQDIRVESATEKFQVQVSRGGLDRWWSGAFPFYDLNVPNRQCVDQKTKLFLGRDLVFFQVRGDLRVALVAFGPDIEAQPVVFLNNKHATGEAMRKLDLPRCMYVSLTDATPTTLGELNLRRIRHALRQDCGPHMKRRILLPDCPYGMPADEWLDEMAKIDRPSGHLF